MEEGKLGDKCPACGVSAKMFEPFDEKLSPKRKFILDRHIHPIMVHVPQGFCFTTLLLALFGLLVPGPWTGDVFAAVKVLSFLLPFVVLGAIFTGLLDGKIRFRRVSTPLLVKKMILGCVFLVAAGVMLAVTQAGPLAGTLPVASFFAANLVAFLASAILGLWGASLISARFPG